MKQQEIHSYLKSFFESTECEFEELSNKHMTVQLTIDMDKALMNRPFYWHYIESTGGEPNPQKITFITDFDYANEIKGELIHFGSPRLQQIFSKAKEIGGYIRLYEKKSGTPKANTPLIPWLVLNCRISYSCDRKKDFFSSIGLNLITGMMVENFHDQLIQKKVPLVPKIPDFSFTFSPLIKPKSGIRRIEQYLINTIHQDDHSWAQEARERWKEDEKLLDRFYEDLEELPDSYFTEKEAIRQQYEPSIDISIINGGIFYLVKSTGLS